MTIVNNKGFALITSLMFTVLSLVLTMTLLYMVMSGIKTSAAMKNYRSATDAAYGGLDVIVKDIINNSRSSAFNSTQSEFNTAITNYISGIAGASISTNCLQIKLTTPKKSWPSACTDVTLQANASNNDIRFNLNSTNGTSPFNIYSKIVDSREYVIQDYDPTTGQKITYTSTGNTDLSGISLDSGGVLTTKNKNTIPSNPYVYRIEIQAERPAPSIEKSQLSVLYVY